jgi:hypothetical protein
LPSAQCVACGGVVNHAKAGRSATPSFVATGARKEAG